MFDLFSSTSALVFGLSLCTCDTIDADWGKLERSSLFPLPSALSVFIFGPPTPSLDAAPFPLYLSPSLLDAGLLLPLADRARPHDGRLVRALQLCS